MQKPEQKALVIALAGIISSAPLTPALAEVYTLSFDGWMTLLNSAGTAALNNTDSSGVPPMYGNRTPITGTLLYDTDTGIGVADITPFSFFGSGPVTSQTIDLQAIGDGSGGSGTLLLGNMALDWNGLNGLPVSLVMDGAGMLNALNSGAVTGDSITGGVLAATENYAFDFGKLSTYTLPMGASPLVTTTFNTTNIGAPVLGTNPSGTLPLTDDGIGGSPMPTGPFARFNANYDITHMQVVSVSGVVPLPDVISGVMATGGTQRECDAEGGSEFELSVLINPARVDDVVSIVWSNNEGVIGTGETINHFVPLGTDTVRVAVETVQGATSVEFLPTLRVTDTVQPTISAAFVHQKTGAVLDTAGPRTPILTTYSATDVCDPEPVVSAVVGVNVNDGQRLRINRNGALKLKVDAAGTSLLLQVSATDASSNTAMKNVTLDIVD